MDYDTRKAAAQAIHEKARFLRGRFLNFVAVIERDIGVILTKYFCTEDEEKRTIFYEKVVEKLSLENKKAILIDIVKRDYPEYWEENKDTLKTLQQIQEFRNKLAHSTVDVSDDALARPLSEGIGFVQWKKGEPITDAVFEEFSMKATTVGECLGDIKQLLPFKERAEDQ